MAGGVVGHNSERGPPKDHSIKVWSQLAKQFQTRRFLMIFFAEFSIFSHGGHNSERGPPKDHSIKVWSQLAKQFQTRRFLMIFFAEFSIFSHGGHLGWRAGRRTQF